MENYPNTLKLGFVVDCFNRWVRCGSFSHQVKASDPIYLLGSQPEILEQSCQSEFQVGFWQIYDYYDHSWGMLGYSDQIDLQSNLIFQRLTSDSSKYGFIRQTNFVKFLTDRQIDVESGDIETDDMIDLSDFTNDIGRVTYGRGDTEYYLYLIQQQNQVVGFLLANDGLLELLTEGND